MRTNIQLSLRSISASYSYTVYYVVYWLWFFRLGKNTSKSYQSKRKRLLTSFKDCTSATNEEFSCLRNIYGGMRYVGKYLINGEFRHIRSKKETGTSKLSQRLLGLLLGATGAPPVTIPETIAGRISAPVPF